MEVAVKLLAFRMLPQQDGLPGEMVCMPPREIFLQKLEDHLSWITAALPDLQRGIAPLGPLPSTHPLLLARGVAPPSCRPWPQACTHVARLEFPRETGLPWRGKLGPGHTLR